MQTGTDRSPPPPWNVGDVTGQCPRGGGCLCMSKSGGVFQIDDVTRTMSKGGGACECLHPPPSGNPVSAPGVPPIQVQTPPPTWMAGYGPAGLHLPLLAGWGGGNDKLAIDKGGNLPEKVENHWYRQIA